MATTFLPAFQDRNMRIYIAGQFPSLLGTWMESAAMLWQAAVIAPPNHKAIYVGLIAGLQTFPSVVLGPFGGALLDRYGLLKTYIVTQAMGMIIAVALAIAAFFHEASMPILVICSVLLGLVQILDRPAQNSLAGILVTSAHLRSATALSSCMNATGMAVGSAMAGLVIAYWGITWTFLINAISFFFVIGALFLVKPIAIEKHAISHPWQMFKEGFSFILKEPKIAMLLSLGSVALLLGNSYQKVLVVLAQQMFNSDPRTYGYLLTAGAIGAITGTAWVAIRPTNKPPFVVAAQTFFMTAVALLAFSQTHMLRIAYGELFLAGLAITMVHPVIRAELQHTAGGHMLGRIMGWSVTFNFGAYTIGSIVAGILIQHLGSRMTVMINGLAALAVGLAALVALRKQKDD